MAPFISQQHLPYVLLAWQWMAQLAVTGNIRHGSAPQELMAAVEQERCGDERDTHGSC